jgi:hypothetical protein
MHEPEPEPVAGGFPVHIAARLLGHASVVATEAYVAVFQKDLIRSYRAFLDKRCPVRPAEEYREPTDDEWRESQEHFHTRKLELGGLAPVNEDDWSRSFATSATASTRPK